MSLALHHAATCRAAASLARSVEERRRAGHLAARLEELAEIIEALTTTEGE